MAGVWGLGFGVWGLGFGREERGETTKPQKYYNLLFSKIQKK